MGEGKTNKKQKSKLYLIILALAGMSACLLPWSRLYMGSLPYGDVPDKIVYGYQGRGMICGIFFFIVLLISLFTSIKKPMTKKVKAAGLIFSGLVFAVCVFDIIVINSGSKLSGVVPLIEIGPFVMGGIAFLMLIIILFTSGKNIGIKNADLQ